MRISDWSLDVCSSDLLLAEALEHAFAMCEFRAQQLECHRDVEGQVGGAIDHAHAADAEDRFDPETVSQHAAGREVGMCMDAGAGGIAAGAGASPGEIGRA